MLTKPADGRRFTTKEIEADVKATIDRLFPQEFEAFRQAPMTAQTFALLLALSEYNFAESIVLWDLLVFHRRDNNVTDFKEISCRELVKQYRQATLKTYANAVERLVLLELVDRQPRVRNTSMHLRINWDSLVLQVRDLDLDNHIPGVTFGYFCVAGSTAF